MQGDIVKAAKWLGGCMIAASLILVIGFHPTFTGRVLTFTKVQPETGGQLPFSLPAATVYSTSAESPMVPDAAYPGGMSSATY